MSEVFNCTSRNFYPAKAGKFKWFIEACSYCHIPPWRENIMSEEQGAESIFLYFFSKLFAPCPMLHAFKSIIPLFHYSNIPTFQM